MAVLILPEPDSEWRTSSNVETAIQTVSGVVVVGQKHRGTVVGGRHFVWWPGGNKWLLEDRAVPRWIAKAGDGE